MNTNIHFWSYLVHFLLEWKMLKTKFVGRIKTYFMSNNSPPEIRAVCEIVWENLVEADRPQMGSNVAHAHCMLGTQGYKHTLRICM